MRFMAIASVSCASLEMEPKRHGAGGEALDDILGRLDLFERHRLRGGLDFEQAAQRAELLVLVVDEVRVFLEGRGVLLRGPRAAAWRWSADCTDDTRRGRATGSCRPPPARYRTRSRDERRAGVSGWPLCASTSRSTPSMRDAVPVKYLSTSFLLRPMASKTCAPR